MYLEMYSARNTVSLLETPFHGVSYTLHPTPYTLFISQIRRASVSIPANIAEGYGRRTRGEYIQFLYIAQGSLKELETHLLLSIRVNLAVVEDINSVLNQCQLTGKILLGLIRSLESRG